ncbi:MAG: phospho-N-acetylmuramoyl-pentapeptide-transferase [Ruminococcus sp.]|nr:phospho-N-acetylmuramoyl-pentapeptide-transferase [Ruminococcus sp.]
MLYHLLKDYINLYYVLFIGVSFFGTFHALQYFKRLLPKDQGREFAVNGALSEGKPRGAGIIIITAFVLLCVLFVPLNIELIIYLALIYLAMITGYLDDAAETPWGELKKGIFDLVISVGISVTYYYYNDSDIYLFGSSYHIPAAIFIILGIILVWASINVTNCSDGIDGLCGSMSLVALLGAYAIMKNLLLDYKMGMIVLCIIVVLLPYLWFNCKPSKLLMGDAGSRALGVIIAVAYLKTGHPFMFIIGAFMLIMDGGAGLIKLSFIRYLRLKNFMKDIRTPIHDHMRKNLEWQDTEVVFRFTLAQAFLTLLAVYSISR